jgi:mannose-6-phosphate isomerase-like protein (cupin superfamily)
MKVRRVVTGHTPEGKARVACDTEVDGITLSMLPGMEFHRLWGGDEAPSFPDDGSHPRAPAYFPPVGGFRFGFFTVPPRTLAALPDDLDMEAGIAEIADKLPGVADHMEPDHPGMHTTDTIDFEYVISGEIILELDDGEEVHLRAGDTVVQNGTRHAWHNRGSEPCRLVVFIVGAHRT